MPAGADAAAREKSRAPRRVRACLGGALLLACGASPPLASAPAPHPSDAPGSAPVATPSAPAACNAATECPAPPNACLDAVCSGGRCAVAAKAGVTSCELSAEQRSHHAFLETADAAVGVCRQGACIPRLQCAELCGGELGGALAERVNAALDACGKGAPAPDARAKCVGDVLARDDLQSSARQGVVECLLACGYPEMKTPG